MFISLKRDWSWSSLAIPEPQTHQQKGATRVIQLKPNQAHQSLDHQAYQAQQTSIPHIYILPCCCP